MPACFLNGLCGIQAPANLKKSIEDPVLAPFVSVQIIGASGAVEAQANNFSEILGGDFPIVIGVGNRGSFAHDVSFPAYVKSFRTGSMRGQGAEIEIIDQEGGDFSVVIERISRGGTAIDSMCWVKWGWISTKCDGSTVGVEGESDSPTEQPRSGETTGFIKFQIMNVSINYSGGTVKYTLHCGDTLHTAVDLHCPGVFGTTAAPVRFRDAVESICNRLQIAVEFVQFTTATTQTPFRFKRTDSADVDPVKGLNGVWNGNNRNVMECLYEWARMHLADVGPNGAGIVMRWDASNRDSRPNGKLFFMADTVQHGVNGNIPAHMQLGTYVVNGGRCSPVLNFRPTISFAINGGAAYASGGTGGGASSPGTTSSRGPAPSLNTNSNMPHIYSANPDDPLRLGHNLSIVLARQERLSRNIRAARTAYNNTYLNSLAGAGWQPITAELRIQGDPTFWSPLSYAGKAISLIVINPFQIEDDSPCKWSNSIQPCQEILSNNVWWVEGCSHDIHAGSYTTTLKIRLSAPGVDSPLRNRIGQP